MTWEEIYARAEGKDVYSIEYKAKDQAHLTIYNKLVFSGKLSGVLFRETVPIIAKYCSDHHIQFNKYGRIIEANNMDEFRFVPDYVNFDDYDRRSLSETYDSPTIISYGNELIDGGYANKVILCLDSAAGWAGFSNQYTASRIAVYTDLSQNELPDFTEKYDIPYKEKDIFICRGLQCTTELQTLCDMLEYEDNIGNQDLYEALSYYYYRNNESFTELENLLNTQQLDMLDLYRQDAIEYHRYG